VTGEKKGAGKGGERLSKHRVAFRKRGKLSNSRQSRGGESRKEITCASREVPGNRGGRGQVLQDFPELVAEISAGPFSTSGKTQSIKPLKVTWGEGKKKSTT